MTERVSVQSDGSQATGRSAERKISADGRFVVFRYFYMPGPFDGRSAIVVRDRAAGIAEIAADDSGDGGAHHHAISADGRFVAFESYDPDVVPGNKFGKPDVVVLDRETGALELASDPSSSPDSYPALSMSGNARYVVYATEGGPVRARDRQTGALRTVSLSQDGGVPNGSSSNPVVSADGRYVVFDSTASDLVPKAGDRDNVYLWDRDLGG